MKRWLAPRLWGLHLLAVGALAVCTLMGLWQLGVYGSKHDDAAAAARSSAPVDLLTIWGPDDPFAASLLNRRVVIRGDIAGQDLFRVKRPDGEEWLAATVPVRGTKSAIVVVWGHLPASAAADRKWPTGPAFTAILQPSDASGDLSIAARVNKSKVDLFSGYALADDPAIARTVKPVSPPDPQVAWTVGLRNLAYALQWWVFGLFAVFMWWRMASDALDVDESVSDAQVT